MAWPQVGSATQASACRRSGVAVRQPSSPCAATRASIAARAVGATLATIRFWFAGQAKFAAMDAGDLAQALEPRCAVQVGDAARFDAQGQVQQSVLALGPAKAVAVAVEVERTRGREGKPGAPFHLGLEPVQTAVVDRVLQTRVLAFAAVAVVALRRHDRLGHGDDLIRLDEAEHVAEARVGLRVAVRRAHAAADGDVEAEQHAVFDDRDEAEVVGEHVDIVARRHGQARS